MFSKNCKLHKYYLYGMKYSFFILFTTCSILIFGQEEFPVNGIDNTYSPVYAFTNAHIIISSEKEIKKGTLLIKDGEILEADSLVEIPTGAIIKDLNGDYIYPSFIDLYSDYGLPKPEKGNYNWRPQYKSSKEGSFHWNESIHPELNSSEQFSGNEKNSKKYLNNGFGVVLSHVIDGISRGSACLVSLSNEIDQKNMITPIAASCFSFKKGVSSQKYPTSLMGSYALLKQLFLDVYWYKENGKSNNLSLNAFINQLSLPHIFQADLTTDYNRIYNLSDEFEINFIIKGNGKEYQIIPELTKFNFPIILPLNFPKDYDIESPEDIDILTLSKLKHWETAPFNPRILSENKINFCFTMYDLEKSELFIKNLRKTIEKGLSKKDALNALTLVPAKLINQEHKLGSLEKGKIANFIICSSDIFEDGEIYENWTNGIKNIINKKNDLDIRGYYTFSDNNEIKTIKISGDLANPIMEEIKLDSAIQKYNISIKENSIDFNSNNKDIIATADYINGNFIGKYINSDGEKFSFNLTKDSLIYLNDKKVTINYDNEIPVIFSPNKAYGNQYEITAFPTIFKNATIWTNEDDGILKNTDIAINNGKIVAIGTNLSPDEIFNKNTTNIQIIDATDKHITCGIIDEHSHIAISRGVNEASQAVTSEVSIGDVINPNDHNIYRQLAGGVTTVQLLHGSANPIGGQSAIIKLRWGSSSEEMKIEGAPGFIKFALGENVKQSNWGEFNNIRFPQTRMGVEQVFYNAFYRAKNYEKIWKEYNNLPNSQKRKTTPPRADLELDALVEILNNERFITCHSYVQSEINMLMHVADSMGFKINTFTHILEGYKLTDKMKNHGAGASTFSDWWAYKFEVNEAIPYNASLLNCKGVLTAINSDDAEMGRRLNHEAAKTIKYGGSSEEDAWKMITLNPAKLLHLDHIIGSLKIGKHADIVIWDGNPLSVYTKVESTYVDGKLLYDINKNIELMDRDKKEKNRIINKMVNSNNKEEKQKIFPSIEHHYHCNTIEDYE